MEEAERLIAARLAKLSAPPAGRPIRSGCISLDWTLATGGFPRGRLVEVYGPEACGKTTVALSAAAEAQKNGGTSAFIDADHALDGAYAAADLEAPGGVVLLVRAARIPLYWSIILEECRSEKVTFPLDMGLFLLVADVIVVSYYLWRVRRWRGLAKSMLVVVFSLASICVQVAVLWMLGTE